MISQRKRERNKKEIQEEKEREVIERQRERVVYESFMNKDENIHRYEIRGGKKGRERERG